MATIAENLQAIKQAVYGSEVRNAIHDSIEQCYSDVTASVTLAAAATDSADSAASAANAKATLASTAADNANAKATLANTAADNANAKATLANTAADNANAKATLASTAADNANAKATLANTAADNANAKATLANTAATTATEKATLADAAATTATEKATLANTAASAADAKAALANTAADNANAKAALADTAASAASAAAQTAQTAADAAAAAAQSVSDAKSAAQNAADNANAKAALAETAATNASSAASSASTAADKAKTAAAEAVAGANQASSDCNTAIYNAGVATASATRAASRADQAAFEMEGLTVSSEDVGPTGDVGAELSKVDGHRNLHLRLRQGATGAPFTIKGNAFETLSALEYAVTSPAIGDQYNVGTEPPYHIYRWTGTQWEFQGTISLSVSSIEEGEINTICDTQETVAADSKKYLDISGLTLLIRNKIKTLLSAKVDKVTGKQLSTNDFSNEHLTSLNQMADEVATIKNTKVDKVTGKQLSTNDFTNSYKSMVDTHESSISAMETIIDQILAKIYPIGSLYISASDTSPASIFGGTWEKIEGRFLLSSGGDYAVGNTGGEAAHTLTTEELASHGHASPGSDGRFVTMPNSASAITADGRFVSATSGGTLIRWSPNWITANAGGGNAHNNMPPYLVVNVWKRTA